MNSLKTKLGVFLLGQSYTLVTSLYGIPPYSEDKTPSPGALLASKRQTTLLLYTYMYVHAMNDPTAATTEREECVTLVESRAATGTTDT